MSKAKQDGPCIDSCKLKHSHSLSELKHGKHGDIEQGITHHDDSHNHAHHPLPHYDHHHFDLHHDHHCRAPPNMFAMKAAPDEFNRVPVSGALDPNNVYFKLSKLGAKKAHATWLYLMLNSLYAGAYIGLGDVLLCAVGAQVDGIKASDPGLAKLIVGSFGLPFGLTMVVLTGAELFTSNTTYMPAAFYEGKCTLFAWARSWIVSWFFNLAGALMLALIVYHAALFDDKAVLSIQGIAEHKVAGTFLQTYLRGILCNWLVNIAVWQATAAQDVASKILGIFLPISAFVTIGFEHCVANMFMIPFGMMLGADISVGDLLAKNLIPATLGNITAGWIFVATSYGVLYGSVLAKISSFVKARVTLRRHV